jgi:hypothetical protein
VDTALKTLSLEGEFFNAFHRGKDVRPRKYLQIREGEVIVEAMAPGYNCKIYEGVYLGILELYGIKTGQVVQTHCVVRGNPTCVFRITW